MMKNKIILRIIIAALVMFMGSSGTPTKAAEYSIKDGAYDDTWRDFVNFYEVGACDRATINGIIRAGGFSPDIVEQLNHELDSIDAQKSGNTTENIVEQNDTSTTTKPKHEHSYIEKEKTERTCTEPGTITYVCECGESYKEVVESGGHHYEATVIQEPTCNQNGEVENKCVYCGEIEMEITAKLEHMEGSEEVVQEPSCDGEGLKVAKCKYCGEVMRREVIAARGHKAGIRDISAPVFLMPGKKVVNCERCGIVLESEVIPPYASSWRILIGIVCGILGTVIVGSVYAKKRKK